MKTLLWLDDWRDPFENPEWLNFSPIGKDVEVHWVKSYAEFTDWITQNGLPTAICFDHDLGDIDDKTELTGYDCAKWLVRYCINYHKPLPVWKVISSNPVGREKIESWLSNFQKYQLENE